MSKPEIESGTLTPIELFRLAHKWYILIKYFVVMQEWESKRHAETRDRTRDLYNVDLQSNALPTELFRLTYNTTRRAGQWGHNVPIISQTNGTRPNYNWRVKECRNPGSNQGPLDLQSNALPTELFRLTYNTTRRAGQWGHNVPIISGTRPNYVQ